MPTFKQILDTTFKGVLTGGIHEAFEGRACALELLSVKRGIPFTDDPDEVRCFDFRSINDMDVLDKLRTEWMLRMLETYEGSLDWECMKQKRIVERIIISTVNQLVAGLPELPEEVVAKCKAAKTLEEAIVTSKAVYGINRDDCPDADGYARDSRVAVASAVSAGNLVSAADPDACAHAAASISFTAACVSFAAINYARMHAVTISNIHENIANIFTTACNIWLEAAKD